jgi:DNA-binding NarL/FixJ family response regulator
MEVLIVDDDTLIHEVLAAVVRKAFPGWDVAFATDLEAAFQRVAHHGEPDLALLDLGLPGQTGLDALRRFRGKFPDMPVVVVSAIEERKAIRAALDAGADGYLPKTLSPQEMLEALKIVAGGDVYVPPQAA